MTIEGRGGICEGTSGAASLVLDSMESWWSKLMFLKSALK